MRWGGDDHDTASFAEISEKIKEYEKRKWGDIITDGINHPSEVEDLCAEARTRLVQLALDDHDRLFRFRFSGAQRLWGVREDDLFRVLWWDPLHKVWPV